VDIGGTFTDLLLVDEAGTAFHVGKTLTTPADPSLAVEKGLVELLGQAGVRADRVNTVVHGTTLLTNAIIEGKGARTALLTTEGFRDAVEIAREHRYDMYDIFLELPRPLVPRSLRREVRERILDDGTVYLPLDEDQAARLIDELKAEGIEAVAVCLLHSYRNPAHERALGRLVAARAPEWQASLSSDVVPEIKEYERASTTIANVYVQGVAGRYLARLQSRLEGMGVSGRLFIMASNGGACTVETGCRFPIRLVESGPAAGALAAGHYGRLMGRPNLLSFDMGGTTAKACLIEHGEPLIAPEFEVARVYRFKKGSGLPIKVPVIEMIEIGAGGGSIARIDRLGLLTVGPESAGAEPGPACYGLGGTAPTVTDADLVLGYLDAEFFLGGRMRLDRERALTAITEQVARPLGLQPIQAAWGIHQVVNENMASAARIHAVERGRDPRHFPLFAFGGAGPVHAYRVAEILRSPAIVCPLGAGVTSTVGFLAAPLAFDFVRSHYGLLSAMDWGAVNRLFGEMEAEGRPLLRGAVPPDAVTFRRSCDMRYRGQGHDLRVPVPPGSLGAESAAAIQAAFEAEYRRIYGHTAPGVPLEVMSWRLIASGPMPALPMPERPPAAGSAAGARKGSRAAFFPEAGGFLETPVYDRYRLGPGHTLAGPAIVEERESTAVIGPKGKASVDGWMNLVIERAG
jgi:N-methylhydantoinase A